MKISKSLILRICLIAGFVLFAQLSLASDPVQVPIPPDNAPLPPISIPHIMTLLPSVSASSNNTELAVFIDYSVANAGSSLYNAENKML